MLAELLIAEKCATAEQVGRRIDAVQQRVTWRLHHLQALLAVREGSHRDLVRQPVELIRRLRREPVVACYSALDEFPSESSPDDAVATTLRSPRGRPSSGRPPNRLAPVGR
jgi:hypothetical protein